MKLHFTVIILSLIFLNACSKVEPPPLIKIATNPWPGYEFLHLAEKNGYFEQVGLNIELVELGSLSDAQTTYVSGYVDGLTSTLIEVIQAEALGGKPLKVIAFTDYSNGGDVIIGKGDINDIISLKGKRVGCEVSSLGLFILQRALVKYGLTLDDVEVVNVEQSDGLNAFKNDLVDAFVSYPPMSLDILKHQESQVIFDTSEIPYEVLDTISVSTDILIKAPNFQRKFLQAWKMAIDFTAKYPIKAYEIMAKREGITSQEFQDALAGMVILDEEKQKILFADNSKLNAMAETVCDVLIEANAIFRDCQNLPNLFITEQSK
ncbi:ABC transporter substrate-binding protein [Colwellia sp. 75C3]|uniref:ABC transporter substrate-binding protein n=1 Tax=Colwellia sp. 75C3 TaxID=888425 RepID=UPI0012FEE988|nr:ABC transporter substrate-binding protein [Colwellia sp. 75C3]